MTLLVPFDGSPLSRTALDRASTFGELMDEEVIALSVIPSDETYARDRDWIERDEPFDPELIAGRLKGDARNVAPDATFRYEPAEAGDERTTAVVDVIRTIREVASEVDASILFIGSENAGRVSTPITSVGDPISDDLRYDVHIVRHADAEV